MKTMNKEPARTQIKLSKNTVVNDNRAVVGGRIIWDEKEVSHTLVLQSPLFYLTKDERKQQDRIYKPAIAIYIAQN